MFYGCVCVCVMWGLGMYVVCGGGYVLYVGIGMCAVCVLCVEVGLCIMCGVGMCTVCGGVSMCACVWGMCAVCMGSYMCHGAQVEARVQVFLDLFSPSVFSQVLDTELKSRSWQSFFSAEPSQPLYFSLR